MPISDNIAIITRLFGDGTKFATVCSRVIILLSQISKLRSTELTIGFFMFDLSVLPAMAVASARRVQ